jgi:hypothetical protein
MNLLDFFPSNYIILPLYLLLLPQKLILSMMSKSVLVPKFIIVLTFVSSKPRQYLVSTLKNLPSKWMVKWKTDERPYWSWRYIISSNHIINGALRMGALLKLIDFSFEASSPCCVFLEVAEKCIPATQQA